MEQNLQYTIALLSRTPATLNALVRDLPEAWTFSSEGDNTWTVFDVVGHLIHADRTDWLPRARKILEFGEAQPFDPFDRLGQVKASQGKSLPQLLDEFVQVRSECINELRSF